MKHIYFQSFEGESVGVVQETGNGGWREAWPACDRAVENGRRFDSFEGKG